MEAVVLGSMVFVKVYLPWWITPLVVVATVALILIGKRR
jgi:hypothetical protein